MKNVCAKPKRTHANLRAGSRKEGRSSEFMKYICVGIYIYMYRVNPIILQCGTHCSGVGREAEERGGGQLKIIWDKKKPSKMPNS